VSAATFGDLPLGSAIMLGVLTWGVLRIVVAMIEARTVTKHTDRTDELLHHIVEVAAVGRDVLSELEDVGKDVRAQRDVTESHDPRGGAR